jgi:hypothetical protein
VQLHKKYKHLWFVFLMIFFIGGSGASIAAVQKIQLDQKMPTAQVIPCHDQQMTRPHHQMDMSHDVTNVVKCHDGQMQDQQHCPDCNNISHCQTINFALDQQIPSLSVSPFLS